MGEIARIINNRLLLDYATFASINTDLQEFYGPQKVPLSTLVRFFYPISAPLTQNNGLIGANHEKEARYILRFYVKYYELLKTYGGVPTGIEARNWLVDNKSIDWWIQNRDCSGKRPADVKQ